ncbi:MAG: C10 family peptidase, partial [Sphingobacterium sp.]
MKKLLIALIVLLTSCSKENGSELPDEQFNLESESQTKFVSKEKARSVGVIFMKKQDTTSAMKSNFLGLPTTKGEDQEIKSVETIYFKDSTTPSMYLIKYQKGGFIIVSATENYYPVLAYSKDNSIDINELKNTNMGLSIWKAETEESIINSHELPDQQLSTIRGMWNELITSSDESQGEVDVLSYTNEQFLRFRERLGELSSSAPGYSLGPLSSAAQFLSPGEYNDLVNIANSYGSPLECTVVGYKRKPVAEVGPLIGTTWHQGSGFNDLCPNNAVAGCVAVAMGQIMKYHQFPLSYSWANMPLTEGSWDSQKLIYDLGLATDMDYGTDGSGTGLLETLEGFSSFGYTVSLNNHQPHQVLDEIFVNNRPVYMTGFRKADGGNSKVGHAWVAEGVQKHDQTVTYFVEYQMIDGNYSSIGGPSLGSPRNSSGFSTFYFYLNWGWNGSGNGWFLS